MGNKHIAVMMASLALIAVSLACTNGEAADFSNNQELATNDDVTLSSAIAPAVETTSPQETSNAARMTGTTGRIDSSEQSASLLQAGTSQAGIWVTGEGTVTLEPDLALVNIGVETEAKTVTEARRKAALAMDAVVAAVIARGLTEKDIQTTSFNIYTRYDYFERSRELIGYTVSNTSLIKVRNIGDVGPIIDGVADAGGNAARIDGISFTVEDTQPFMAKLREDAVSDALSKANQFASLTGVSVGRLVYIAEVGSGTPAPQGFDSMEGMMMRAASAPVTSISGGELELSLRVQLAFSIQ